MWILILTLVGGSNGTSPAVTSVGPFMTKSSCLDAGNAYIKQVQGEVDRAEKALCVKDR